MIKCTTIGSETNRGTTLIKEYTFNDLNDVSDSTMIYIDRRRVNMRLVCLNLESAKENNTDIRKILLEKIQDSNPHNLQDKPKKFIEMQAAEVKQCFDDKYCNMFNCIFIGLE